MTIIPLQVPQMRGCRRTGSVQSAGSADSILLKEESIGSPEMVEEAEENVYVALGKDDKEGKATLLWTLQNSFQENKIVVIHVHLPAQMIPIKGVYFPASHLTDEQVRAHRQLEREKTNTLLDEYLALCSQAKVHAEKHVIEADDIGKGLVKLIALRGIDNLVMGAKRYSRKMKAPKSKTASLVHKKANPSCNIWFVCKGDLICTREAGLDGYGIVQSPAASHLRSVNFDSPGRGITVASPLEGDVKTSTTRSTTSTEGRVIGISSSQASDDSSCSPSEVLGNIGPLSTLKDEEGEVESVVLPPVHESDEDEHFSSAHEELEDVGTDDEVYEKLQCSLAEVESLRRKVYDVSRQRQKAERDAIEAARKANTAINSHLKELELRKEIEATLVREKVALEKLKIELHKVLEELKKACEQKSALELRIADYNCIVKDLEEKLSEAQHLRNSHQRELEELQQERDDAVRKLKELTITSTHSAMSFSDFSYFELQQATNNFDDSMKIGEGGYGSVYKGFLRHTTVAIKMLNPQSMQGKSEFHQEVEILSRVRHPHLVTLIGACPESWALIYEYCSNGSLEDHLVCKDNTLPLTWQARTRIATEICSALIFLHSNKPHSIVHGDLKPANILIDANFVSKLGDFGICRILNQSTTTTLYHHTHPKGTFVYMDPEFLASGDLTHCSDVYSFGVVLLRLLSGRRALGIIKEVQEAYTKGRLHGVLDPTAGNWPFVQAKQLAYLALRCCDSKRKNRPDLAVEAWKVLEPMTKAASMGSSPLSFGSAPEDNSCIPSYFICPIFQEIMRDPHIAADGFTYEAEAVKGWLESGHDTSPMTNLKLARPDLIPNHALRSAIQEWLLQHK